MSHGNPDSEKNSGLRPNSRKTAKQSFSKNDVFQRNVGSFEGKEGLHGVCGR